jgi:hypothetical protein
MELHHPITGGEKDWDTTMSVRLVGATTRAVVYARQVSRELERARRYTRFYFLLPGRNPAV